MIHDRSEYRFWWFVCLAVALHGLGLAMTTDFLSKRPEPVREERLRVDLRSIQPSLPPVSPVDPRVMEQSPPPQPVVREITPPDAVRQPPRPKPRRPDPSALPRPKAVKADSPLLDAPPVAAAAPRPAPSAPSTPPTRQTGATSPESMPSYAGYFSTIRAMIEEKRHYPLISRRTRQEGAVKVRFTIGRDGRLRGEPTVEAPSRFPALDRAALESVSRAAPFPPIPHDLGNRLDLSLVILFQLTE